jgi:phosphocarrier protein HPr
MLQQETTIVNKLGLHARASAKLTQLAGNFQAEIWMSRNGRRINAKSIMGVMMLAAGIGSTVLIEIRRRSVTRRVYRLFGSSRRGFPRRFF